ncbi:transglycosylase domain-containing protein [Actinocrispum sp. NPDC049592]|uniref:transglycosylase domain-containing protein n=1 Tax=Actinocrispum sp. NPDC049592 TaxID=3154835 RepID=UPI0034175BDC
MPPGARPPMGPGGPGTPPRGNPAEQVTQRVAKPAGPSEQKTDMLTPLNGRGRAAAEPELLTHREFEDEGYEDPDSLYDEPYETDEEARRRRRKKIWKRVRRTSYVFLALMIIGPIVAFFVMYQLVDVPDPKALANTLPKTVTVNWGNGQQMTTIAPPDGKRTLVEYKDIPEHVLNAVYAAEDATFRTNSGFDLTGIMRAVWNNLTGGQGGGSTITQQYVKKATENEEKTLTRKATELVKAYKMSNTMSKEDIITAYLNTIYFGRGANGIVAAAKAYYGKDLKDITKQEAATLAGVIQGPSREVKEPDYPEKRWNYVMDKMIENHWATPQDKAAGFPQPIESDSASSKMTPDQSLIWQAALRELQSNGIERETITKGGYTVNLTVDPTAQQMAQDAINTTMQGQPENLRQALVAVDPNTGRIIAYYGYNKARGQLDYAGQAWQNPGSSYKPFDLVALLHQGKGLYEVYDGRSNRKFGGATINNSEGSNKCGDQCTVAEAMKQSVNTVFADIAFNTVGTRAVAKAAIEAGIPNNVGAKQIPLEGQNGNPPNVNIAIGGDVYQARPVDMAGAYATFAANGTKHKAHLVQSVIDPASGKTVWEDGSTNLGMAFNKSDPENNAQIARNVTESLLPIPESSKIPCDGGRECAGKTGTHGCADTAKTNKSDNCAAWMVGYTPQISTAVWVGSDDNSALWSTVKGQRKIVFGSGLPGLIWQKFMNAWLKGKPKMDFPPLVPIGKSKEDYDRQNAASSSAENPQGNSQSQNSNTQGNSQSQPPSSETTTTTKKGGGGPTISLPGGPGGPGGPGNPTGTGRGGDNNPNDFQGG